MADKTGIQWTDATWNPTTGCTKVSPGCKFCYAKHQAWPRLKGSPNTLYTGREFEDVQGHEQRLDQPLRWQRPRLIFVNSLSDLFHEDIPFDFIDRVFGVMSLCSQHVFQILTKRPERMREYLSDDENRWALIECAARATWRERTRKEIAGKVLIGPLRNVWLGVSVENQETFDERVPLLMQTPAHVRWLSVEPLLAAIDASTQLEIERVDAGGGWRVRTKFGPGIEPQWAVIGGESGPNARPLHISWVRELAAQFRAARVPYFVKQLGQHVYADDAATWPDGTVRREDEILLHDRKGGDFTEWPEDLRVREYPPQIDTLGAA